MSWELLASLFPCSQKDDFGGEKERERGAQRGLLFWNVALKLWHMGTRLSILGFLSVGLGGEICSS